MQDWGTGSWLTRRARTCGDRVAYTFRGKDWTYAQARDRAARLAHALRGLGVGRGDRVAYLGLNHPALLEGLFAAAQLGAVFVPLNFRLAAAELSYLLDDAGCRVIVYGPGHAEVLRETGAMSGRRRTL